MAKFGRPQDRRYLVEEFSDGSLLLVPAVTISAAELAALSNHDVVEAIDAAQGDRHQLQKRSSRVEL
jgi:hypothetical protein